MNVIRVGLSFVVETLFLSLLASILLNIHRIKKKSFLIVISFITILFLIKSILIFLSYINKETNIMNRTFCEIDLIVSLFVLALAFMEKKHLPQNHLNVYFSLIGFFVFFELTEVYAISIILNFFLVLMLYIVLLRTVINHEKGTIYNE